MYIVYYVGFHCHQITVVITTEVLNESCLSYYIGIEMVTLSKCRENSLFPE